MVEFNSKIATVVCQGGQHFLVMPSGEVVPGVYLTRVMDEAGEIPQVLVKMYVNIAESAEQALKLYAKAQEDEKGDIVHIEFQTEKGKFLAVRLTSDNVTIRENLIGTNITDGDRSLNLRFHVGDPIPVYTKEIEHKKDIVEQIEWNNGLKTYKNYTGTDVAMTKFTADDSFKSLMESINVDINEPGWVIFKQI